MRKFSFRLKANLGGIKKWLGFLSGLGYAASLVEEPARRSWEHLYIFRASTMIIDNGLTAFQEEMKHVLLQLATETADHTLPSIAHLCCPVIHLQHRFRRNGA